MKTLIEANRRLVHPILNGINLFGQFSFKFPQAIPLGSGRPDDQFCKPLEQLPLIDLFATHVRNTMPHFPVNRRLGQYGPTAGIICDIVAKYLKKDEN